MLFMVIERFRDNDMLPIYKRVRDEGRSLPQGLKYIDSWVEPNLVVVEIRVISVLRAVISAWAAVRAAVSFAPVLALWTDRSRMRFSMEWTSPSAPSAVWAKLRPSWALRVA